MRSSVEHLPTAVPLKELLPSVFLEESLRESFAVGFTEGLDPMLAPVHLTLDCLEAYLDPRLAPVDFLPWLASWVGIELDETLPEERQREMIITAGPLHHLHGTRIGLIKLLQSLTGGSVEIQESGGVSWSAEPGAPPPGSPEPGLEVFVGVAQPDPLLLEQVERVVRDARPAHLPFRVQVMQF